VPSPSGIAHAGLPFANPMSEAAVDEAIAALPVDREALVLETGRGTAEILLRTLRRRARSASGARCLAAATPSGLRSVFYAPDRRDERTDAATSI
jgi:hypothetical protein